MIVAGNHGFTVSRIETGTNLVFNHLAGVDLASIVAPNETGIQLGSEQYVFYDGWWDVPWSRVVYLPTQACFTVVAPEPFYWIAGGHGSISGTATCGEAPTLTRQPQDTNVIVGEAAIFEVAATGTQPLFYYWQFQGPALSNAFGSTLILTNVQSSQTGDYRVIVSNAVGSVVSEWAALTVKVPQPPPPRHWSQPPARHKLIPIGVCPLVRV